MIKFAIYLFLAFMAAIPMQAQDVGNAALARAMDSIYRKDQQYRLLLQAVETHPALKDSIARAAGITADADTVYFYLLDEVLALDAANVRFIDSVTRQEGFPGIKALGPQRAHFAWLVIQHSDSATLSRYLPIIKEAADKKDLPFYCYAYSADKDLVRKGKAQRYGSQIREGVIKKTGKTMRFIWPVEVPGQLNERRKAAGLADTVEEYARSNGFTYQVVKLGEFTVNTEKE
ncbi:hypothetical protein DLD77_06230 [Chitinophaga alhagiae]|uniref:Uncharacterized protein n=1 Tax=Chitinophaga alhagiae TaxID=2203219 RepID=A0ABM6WBG2_9BACT|nr:DUF6624 domain-containing protein [Chitinophaga alhagiae]AWO01313.1 hypothetical protein DLD77_06230 [Chitinophaga alhagiae]